MGGVGLGGAWAALGGDEAPPAPPPPAAPPAAADPGPLTTLPASAFEVEVPLPAPLLDALARRDHAAAATLFDQLDPKTVPGAFAPDVAFLRAWTLQRAGRGAEAVKLLDQVRLSTRAPAAYRQLVVGEALLADGQAVAAAEALASIQDAGAVEVRVRLALADAWQKAGRTADARAALEALSSRPDPAPGGAAVLLALAQKAPDAAARSRLAHRLYRYYPTSDEATAAAPWLGDVTAEDLAWRGFTLQEAGRWDSAVDLLDDRLAAVPATDAVGCLYRYSYGRAQHKRNNLTEAAAVLAPLGRACRGLDDDRGARALYLAGRSLERKKDWAGAAELYLAIPALYPTHSMADDGYTFGGIGRQEAGDLAGARAAWQKGFEAYPTGDMAGETAWRLAWATWLGGDTPSAVRWAERCRDEVPLANAPTEVLGCAYWAARWRAWPSRAEPSRRSADPAELAAAAEGLAALASAAPWHYYGAQAAARLAALAPDKAAALTRPAFDPDDAPWQVSAAFAASPAGRNAAGLVAVGLVEDAVVELASLDEGTLTGAEMAIRTGLTTRAGDFLIAHDQLRGWLKTHPPDVLGPNRWKVMRQAYPLRWWPEVQTAATYGWDPRLFHALVREESNFNPQIRSHAGACGLSQLMPGTASTTAKQMGLTWKSSLIWDPATNLRVGAWFLDSLHRRYKGNSALALAAYNAGPGNADRWLAENPGAPSDVVVEAIDFRETRQYVKRVSSTWQTYRLLYGTEALYPDLSAFVDRAVP